MVTHNICDFLIIGGGIVGLAIAHELSTRFPRKRIVVLEKERGIALHQTGRNSGVIHSGIYYRPGSLKAKTCVRGVEMLKEFCQQHGVPMQTTGKVIVATDSGQVPYLHELHRRGEANGLAGVEIIGPDKLREIEPHAHCVEALWVPSTGIVDYRAVCQKFAEMVRKRGGKILLHQKVRHIHSSPYEISLRTRNSGFRCRYLFNCAGLHADRIAHIAGVDCQVKLIPFRGEYYKLVPQRQHLVKGLIYPVPDPSFPFLGVHLTRMIDGSVEAGPNAVLALKREGYRKTSFSFASTFETMTYPGFWKLALRHWRRGGEEMLRSFSKNSFVANLQKLLPELQATDVIPFKSGIRAQALTADGRLIDDFHLLTSRRMIHVINAPSPAATACLAIAGHIVDMAKKEWELPD